MRLPVDEYLARLNRKRTAAGVVFRDHRDWVLLVEPSYKLSWEIPGGAVEADESPWAGARRELIEELGLDLPLGRLLAVDYVRPYEGRPEGLVFLFDGGILDDADLAGFTFPDGEIISASFHPVDELHRRTKPLLANRIAAALGALREGTTALCEHGVRIG